MAALVKINDHRVLRYIRFEEALPTVSRITKSSMALEIEGGIVTLESGKDAGKEVSEGVIEPNQRASITMGSINPFKYNPVISINPELLALADVRIPTVYEAGEERELVMHVTAHKKVDIGKLDWLVRMYIID